MLSYILLCGTLCLQAQGSREAVYVDKNGKLRHSGDKTEAYFWGVNYTVPFAHAYRQIGRNGADHKAVIEADAYHLSRLGVNAYRIHVWDSEISDVEGNLIENSHLDLLDYLIHQFQQRGIYILLTPIAYWGNGYPEPDERDLPGFSGKFGKGNAYTDPDAIKAQERYLTQFLNHVNPYNGVSYKNDPMIIAFEVCNEPGHSVDKAKETTAFVKKMRAAIRATGCKKPVLYNVTQSIELLEDFIKGGTDGVTFQWYPSGLVAGHERKGTFLPHVDKYDMPFENEKYFRNQARLVYEFDAADIGRSYMYPPIALSFKEAGMQWVTQFAYDPTPVASSNTEYQTHFLNLAYAPQKAIGFKIAGELFRNPKYNRDRANEDKPFAMPDVTISYEDDLAALNNGELYCYTNNTTAAPKDETTLKAIAGYGASPVVEYEGRGAYFIDKISDGVWRLEVMPDAIWVRDPFSRATPRIENVVIAYNEYPMTVRLSNLGNSFAVTGINAGNSLKATASGSRFTVKPGVYILSTQPFTGDAKSIKIGTARADEYFAPPATAISKPYFLHTPPAYITEGQNLLIEAEYVGATPAKQLSVQLSGGMSRGWRPPTVLSMKQQGKYRYTAVIPDSLVKAGALSYTVRVETEQGAELIYPGGVEGPANDWTYYNPEIYSVQVLPRKSAIPLLTADDANDVITQASDYSFALRPVPSIIPGESVLKAQKQTSPFPMWQSNDVSGTKLVVENYVGERIKAIAKFASDYSQIEIRAKAADAPVAAELSLIDRDGNTYTAKLTLSADKEIYTLPLSLFQPGRMALLPRPFPGFLPFWYSSAKSAPLHTDKVERIQWILPTDGNVDDPAFELKYILLK